MAVRAQPTHRYGRPRCGRGAADGSLRHGRLYFTDLVALLEKGLETTIKNDKGGGEKGGEKGGGGGEPALFSAEELARLLQARQDFLAIQGRTLRPELTKHLEERKLQVLGHARLPADGSTMHGVQAVPEQLLSA